MKKSTFILALLCLGLNTSYSQFSLGIKGAISKTYVPATQKDFVNADPISLARISVGEGETRKSFGMSLLGENEKLFFMMDGLYSESSQKFKLVSSGLGRSILDPALNFEYNSSNLRFIVTAGAKYKNFRIGAGPEISFVMNERETLSEVRGFQLIDSKYLGGFNFLLGYTLFDHIQLDVKYVKYFENIGSAYKFEGIPVDLKSSPYMLEFSLGFYL